MSRIGKKPVSLEGLKNFSLNDGILKVNLQNKDHSFSVPKPFYLEQNGNAIHIKSDGGKSSLSGLYRSLLANFVSGFTNAFELTVNLNGVGFKASVADNFLTLSVGFSHIVKLLIPEICEVKINSQNSFSIKSFDKEKLGAFAALIKSVREVEPYKGRGIFLEGDFIIRKSGKSKK